MNSFYGGRDGRTYNIVQHYDSIHDMTTAFAQGGAYTDVNYGQYVIIDTPNKNDDTNGIIYRRGLDWDNVVADPTKENPGAGAIYIGQIVGPQGPIPPLQIVSAIDISTIASTVSSASVSGTVSGSADTTAATVYFGAELDDNNSVIGNIVAFDFPNTVVNVTAITDDASSTSLISTGMNDNSFYHNYTVKIPKGISKIDYLPGSSVSANNIPLIDGSSIIYNDAQYLTFYQYNYDENGGTEVPIGAIIYSGAAYNYKGHITDFSKIAQGGDYEFGFEGMPMGWILSFTYTDTSTTPHKHVTEIYGYDSLLPVSSYHNYTINGTTYRTKWRKISSLEAQMVDPDVVVAVQHSTAQEPNLNIGGLWFVLSDGV